MTDQLLAVARAYCTALDCPIGRASQHSLGDWRLLVGLEAGASSITLRRADVALRWFAENWPDSAVWPDSVPRPAAQPERASA